MTPPRTFYPSKTDGGALVPIRPEKKGRFKEKNEENDAAGVRADVGLYIPPFKLSSRVSDIINQDDKGSIEYQMQTWEALRKSINGLINRVTATNIKNIVPELLAKNLVRGRGLFCTSCIKSQLASPCFTDVFAAVVAVINSKIPDVGALLLRRIVLQFESAYKRNQKPQLVASVKFLAHLVNQHVVHERTALEIFDLLLENPTTDSAEVAIGFLEECGFMLSDLAPGALDSIFDRLRSIQHEGKIEKKIGFLIEGVFALRKAMFQGHGAVRPELDLVEVEDRFTHEISLLDEMNPETALDIFKPCQQFSENEKIYEELKKKKKIFKGEASEDEADSDETDDEEFEEDTTEQEMKIEDETHTNLVNLRRAIYLNIMSSSDIESAEHKLLSIQLDPGQEIELCTMLLECCCQERTYLRYYGLLGQRLCMVNKIYQDNFEKCFVEQYTMVHSLETNKLRNVAKLFAHLLATDALTWHILAYIRLSEEDTNSSSHIFIKILLQELSEHIGRHLLIQRLSGLHLLIQFELLF